MIGGIQLMCFEGTMEPLAKQFRDFEPCTIFNENKLTISILARDAGKYLIVLRQIFVQGLAAPIRHSARAQTKLLAVDRNRLDLDRLVVNSKVRQPDQPLAVMLLPIRRLHQVAAEVIVERRQSTGHGMPPGKGLNSCEALRGQLNRGAVHADLRVDQDV